MAFRHHHVEAGDPDRDVLPPSALRYRLPFTLAHPAAVLPFRRVLVFSALIVGSLSPDFHYFFNLGPRGHFSHSIKGAFLFALPVSITVLWVFHTVMKAPLIALAPQRHQEKLFRFATPFRWLPASRLVLILLSLMMGIATHLLWDSITHEHGLVVRNYFHVLELYRGTGLQPLVAVEKPERSRGSVDDLPPGVSLQHRRAPTELQARRGQGDLITVPVFPGLMCGWRRGSRDSTASRGEDVKIILSTLA